MRTTRLVRIAAEAEALRLRRLVRRQIVRGVLGAVALIFLGAALASAHIVGYFALRYVIAPVFAALIILGIDVVLCVVFVVLAVSNGPGEVEREALSVRRQALLQASVVTPVARYLPKQTLYTLLLAGLTARHLAGGGRR
jgi:hypothetical protein